MTSKAEPSPKVTWDQRFADFTIVLQSGNRVKVHKWVLAKNSEVFDNVLTTDMEETKKNKLSLEHFNDETVISFIEYLYADCIKDPDLIGKIRAGVGPDEYIYKRSFACEKLTFDLLRIGHMYQVEELKTDCTDYLKKNIRDDNVIDVLQGADTLENEGLASMAIQHLADRPKGKTLRDVPGFNKALQSNGKPLRDLLLFLSDKNSEMKEEILNLKEENDQLKANVKLLEEPGIIKVTVEKYSGKGTGWTEEFYARKTDLVSTVIEKVRNKRGEPAGHSGQRWMLSTTPMVYGLLEDNKTFEQNSVTNSVRLYAL